MAPISSRVVTVDEWLKRESMIEPEPCSRCRVKTSVIWTLTEASVASDCSVGWGSVCLTHGGVERIALAKSSTAIGIVEVDGGVRIYQAPDRVIEPRLIAHVCESFAQLFWARKIWARKTGKFRVIREPDGSFWLPWDPLAFEPRYGSMMPLVRRQAGSKSGRRCAVCRARIDAGAPVWRPRPGALERGSEPWSTRSLAEVVVCDSCVELACRPDRPTLRVLSSVAE